MSKSDALLIVKDLSLSFSFEKTLWPALRGVNLTLWPGEIVTLVGESGCGKSLTGRAILRLPPEDTQISGSIYFQGQDLLSLPEVELEGIRGSQMAMIFQEPMTALNPVLTCGEQVVEVLVKHKHMSVQAAYEKTSHLFSQVGIPEPERRLQSYPHQLSGGLRQRVMIAMALSCDPSLLLADEPTTALDSTMRQQILDLIVAQSHERGLAVLMISHDLVAVETFASRVCVMYAGIVVEEAKTSSLFANPIHPYTQGLLLASLRNFDAKTKRLPVIPGSVPTLLAMPKGCPFAPRCSKAKAICQKELPKLRPIDDHFVACHLF